MNEKKLGDLVISILFIALGVFAIVTIQAQTSSSVANTGATTFRTFPTFFGAVLIVLCLINIIRIFISETRDRAKEEPADTATAEQKAKKRAASQLVGLRVAGIFTLTLVFSLLLKRINFALLSFALLFISFAILGQKRIWLNFIVAAIGSFSIYLIFVVFLGLSL